MSGSFGLLLLLLTMMLFELQQHGQLILLGELPSFEGLGAPSHPVLRKPALESG